MINRERIIQEAVMKATYAMYGSGANLFTVLPAAESAAFQKFAKLHKVKLPSKSDCGVYAVEKDGELVAYFSPVFETVAHFQCKNCIQFPQSKQIVASFYDKYSSDLTPYFNPKYETEFLNDFILNMPSYVNQMMDNICDNREQVTDYNYFVYLESQFINKDTLAALKHNNRINVLCDHDIYCFAWPKG